MEKFESFEDAGIFPTRPLIKTESQNNALNHIKSGKNVFITGVAGTGKTWLLQQIAIETGRPVELFATSGMTAINLGGSTISSNMALCLYGYEESLKSIKDNNPPGKYPLDTIIVIDEIGLMSIEQFQQVDYALRCIGDEKLFCGGFQMIVSGDFRQMPTMHWGTSLEKSKILKKFTHIELVECIRQKNDIPFFDSLMEIRTKGITPLVKNFLTSNAKQHPTKGVTITATRSLMDSLNGSIKTPEDHYEFWCDLNDENRLYESIKIWEGMPVIICSNNSREGYANGDTGIIIEIEEDFIEEDFFEDDEYYGELVAHVLLDRTGKTVTVKKHLKKYSEFCEKQEKVFVKKKDNIWVYLPVSEKFSFEREWKILKKQNKFVKREGIQNICIENTFCYEYMPLLPAYYLSIRRVQGLTIKKGNLHESILNAEKYSKDYVNIQYVALSRFEKIKKCYIQGLLPLDKKLEKSNMKNVAIPI